jgi:hypothetical protein
MKRSTSPEMDFEWSESKINYSFSIETSKSPSKRL